MPCIDTHPVGQTTLEAREALFCASLDHTIWFHAPLSADRWHLHDFCCVHSSAGAASPSGHVFSDGRAHVATVAQEVLLRDGRQPPERLSPSVTTGAGLLPGLGHGYVRRS